MNVSFIYVISLLLLLTCHPYVEAKNSVRNNLRALLVVNAAPTNSPTDRDECENSFLFRYRGKSSKTCDSYVAIDPATRCRKFVDSNLFLVSPEEDPDAKRIKFHCPATCRKRCKNADRPSASSSASSSAPSSASPSASPSSSPSTSPSLSPFPTTVRFIFHGKLRTSSQSIR